MRAPQTAKSASQETRAAGLLVSVVAALILAAGLVGVWLWSTTVGAGTLGEGPTSEVLVALGANAPSLVDEGEWHRVFVSVVLHSGPGHLIQNALWLVLLGTAYARLTRPRRMIAVCVAGGVLGQVTSYLVRAGTSVGASGAVYALAAALVVVVWRRRQRLTPDIRWRVMLCAAIFVAILLLAPLTMTNADHAAHLGGFVSGGLLAWFLPGASAGRFPGS